jgi:hypothetical protein
VIDNNAAGGNTQLIHPNDVPHTVGNVSFGLPHYAGPRAVRHPDGNAYFTGGYNSSSTTYVSVVMKFNPDTNTSSAAASMNTPRHNHAATVVGNQIIVCGGEIYCYIVQKL